MTQKELLYFEDAISHEQNIIAYLNDMLNSINYDNLIPFIEEEQKKHKNTQKKLIKVIKEYSND